MIIKGIGTTMYQWDMEYRNRSLDFKENLGMAIGEMVSCGLDSVQARMAYADTEENAKKLLALCNEAGLQLSSLYADCMLYDQNLINQEAEAFIKKAETAAVTGCRLIAVNMATPKGRDKTEDEIKVQAEGLNRIGNQLAELKMKIAIHNHTSEMKNDAREFKLLMKNIDADNVGICLDISWTDMAGAPYYNIIEQYYDRLFEVHIRNNIDRIKGFSQSVDEGTISYPEIHKQLKELNYEGWYVQTSGNGLKLACDF